MVVPSQNNYASMVFPKVGYLSSLKDLKGTIKAAGFDILMWRTSDAQESLHVWWSVSLGISRSELRAPVFCFIYNKFPCDRFICLYNIYLLYMSIHMYVF